jgi:hypothetical protein
MNAWAIDRFDDPPVLLLFFWFCLLILGLIVAVRVLDRAFRPYRRWALRRDSRILEEFGLRREMPSWVASWWQIDWREEYSGAVHGPVARVLRAETPSSLERRLWLAARRRGYDVWIGSLGQVTKRVYSGGGGWTTITKHPPTGLVLVELHGSALRDRLQTPDPVGSWKWLVRGQILAVAHEDPSLRTWPAPGALLGTARALRRVLAAMDDAVLLAELLCEPGPDTSRGTLPGPGLP